jgi:hypothetical protein
MIIETRVQIHEQHSQTIFVRYKNYRATVLYTFVTRCPVQASPLLVYDWLHNKESVFNIDLKSYTPPSPQYCRMALAAWWPTLFCLIGRAAFHTHAPYSKPKPVAES